MTILLAPGLTLPEEAVTSTTFVVGIRGSGKTFTAAVLVEELLDDGAQVVAIDPLDAWYGLQSSADGKAAGYPVYVFGGDHGDIPLAGTSGTVVADFVVDTGASVVCSLRHLSKGLQRRFVAEFAERLYQRKGEGAHRAPLHVVIDEADMFVPQNLRMSRSPGENFLLRSYGAIDDLVRRGRSSGVGVTLITQRPAVIAKDVLTQCEMLVAHRVVSPQDRKALGEWVEAHDTEGVKAEFLGSLAALDVGEAWVWSPGFLDVFAKVRIRARRTFDSSATPKRGEKPVQPSTRAAVDLDALRDQMAATVAEAEANDPKRLRARVAELTRELAARPTETETVTVAVVPPEVRDVLASVDAALAGAAASVAAAAAALTVAETVPPPQAPQARQVAPPPPRAHQVAPPAGAAPPTDPDGAKVTGGAKRMLEALARWPNGLTRSQLATQAHLGKKGGTFGTYLSRLRSAGLATVSGDHVTITPAGTAFIGGSVAPLDPVELRAFWRDRFTGGAQRMFDLVVDAYPNGYTRDGLADAAGVAKTGGTFGTYLSRLRSNDCIVEVDGVVTAHPDLFP